MKTLAVWYGLTQWRIGIRTASARGGHSHVWGIRECATLTTSFFTLPGSSQDPNFRLLQFLCPKFCTIFIFLKCINAFLYPMCQFGKISLKYPQFGGFLCKFPVPTTKFLLPRRQVLVENQFPSPYFWKPERTCVPTIFCCCWDFWI